jgi:hypothetical protein
MMKTEQIQEFRSSGVLTITGLIGLALAIIATPWNRQMEDTSSKDALHKAEIVGYQVVQIYRDASANSSKNAEQNRLPASISSDGLSDSIRTTGTMGLDPWGSAYHYRILSADDRGSVRILVWSSGPNKIMESTALDNESTLIQTQPSYSGDDVGVLLSMAHR